MAREDGQSIQYPPILQTLGSDYQQTWGESTHEEIKRVQTSVTSSSTFGSIPAARDFATVYAAAQHVYEATLRGIREDLVAAAAALAQAGEEIRTRDEASAEAFQTLMARWTTDDGFSSSQEHDAASRDEQVREGQDAQTRLDEATRQDQGPDASGGTPGAPAGTPSGGGDVTGMDTGGNAPADG